MTSETTARKFSQSEILAVQDELFELASSIDAAMDLASNACGDDSSVKTSTVYFTLKPLREKTQGIIDALS